jgi:hypothetical protein
MRMRRRGGGFGGDLDGAQIQKYINRGHYETNHLPSSFFSLLFSSSSLSLSLSLS